MRGIAANSTIPIRATTLFAAFFLASCGELKTPEPNPYLAESKPPSVKELRWINGATAKTLDPAFSGAAPEIDIVRSMYEGLTVTDPKTLEAVPGLAESWTVSDNGLVWTFKLRDDAMWSNGRAVTANDLVRSWQRLNKLGPETPHRNLLDNFARSDGDGKPAEATDPEDFDDLVVSDDADTPPEEPSTPASTQSERPITSQDEAASLDPLKGISDLNILPQDAATLVVKLIRPDRDFPRVVAHPIFSPVYEHKKRNAKPSSKTVTNGAFKITAVDGRSITLERSGTYWNREAIALDRISFISTEKAEDALIAYRDGNADVVTNTDFPPLAQKLFSPYADFKKSPFGALNFYEINHRKPPFNDRRVREALSISIDREKLSDELEGTTQPAFSFLPFSTETRSKIVQDRERAAELLEQAGFGNGVGFPTVRLVINRNEVQHRVARSVAAMWKAALNIETDIFLAETTELENIRVQENFDLLRRGVVFPTTSEFASITAIFASNVADLSANGKTATPSPALSMSNKTTTSNIDTPPTDGEVFSESAALFDMYAIPLYFPISFALVKPYVDGFEMNGLDVRSTVAVSINGDWRPPVR